MTRPTQVVCNISHDPKKNSVKIAYPGEVDWCYTEAFSRGLTGELIRLEEPQ